MQMTSTWHWIPANILCFLFAVHIGHSAPWEGSDDFTGGISPAKWTLNQLPGQSDAHQGVMTVSGVNGHASFLVPASTTSEQQSVLFWNGFPSATNDWVAQVSGHNTAGYSGDQSQFQLNLFGLESTNQPPVFMYAFHMARGGSLVPNPQFHTDWAGSPPAPMPAPNASFTLRLKHKAASKTVEAWYDPDGSGTWFQFDSIDLSTLWPAMQPTNLFVIGVFANCYYGPITEGQLFADQFFMTSSLPNTVSFATNSDVITNRWLGASKVGTGYSLAGIGDYAQAKYYFSIVGRETVLGVKCLVARVCEHGRSGGDFFEDFWIAQDTGGNVWVFKMAGKMAWTAPNLNELVLVKPGGDLRIGQRLFDPSGAFIEVLATNQSIPRLSTGLGPYSGCVKLRWTSGNRQDTDDSWECPGLGKVREDDWISSGQTTGWERRAPIPIDPIDVSGSKLPPGMGFHIGLSNAAGADFAVFSSTNVALPLSDWKVTGGFTETVPGKFDFTDFESSERPFRFYQVCNIHRCVTPRGMVLIPAGSFTMGDTLGDGYSNELPTHTVYVSAFYMDKYEVTKALWDEVYNWATNHGYAFQNPGCWYRGTNCSKGLNHPVYSINWYDSVKWCNARSEKEGRNPAYFTDAGLRTQYRSGQMTPYVNWNTGYRLPTEAEWEKASRGGTSGQRFPWGNTITHSLANYQSFSSYTYDTSPTRRYHPTFYTGSTPYTSPVGYFSPNGYGLYDMSGNVWEWCWDWNGAYSSGTQSDPHGPTSGSDRVVRGGSWLFSASYCRTAYRDCYYPTGWDDFMGFRSVLPLGP